MTWVSHFSLLQFTVSENKSNFSLNKYPFLSLTDQINLLLKFQLIFNVKINDIICKWGKRILIVLKDNFYSKTTWSAYYFESYGIRDTTPALLVLQLLRWVTDAQFSVSISFLNLQATAIILKTLTLLERSLWRTRDGRFFNKCLKRAFTTLHKILFHKRRINESFTMCAYIYICVYFQRYLYFTFSNFYIFIKIIISRICMWHYYKYTNNYK